MTGISRSFGFSLRRWSRSIRRGAAVRGPSGSDRVARARRARGSARRLRLEHLDSPERYRRTMSRFCGASSSRGCAAASLRESSAAPRPGASPRRPPDRARGRLVDDPHHRFAQISRFLFGEVLAVRTTTGRGRPRAKPASTSNPSTPASPNRGSGARVATRERGEASSPSRASAALKPADCRLRQTICRVSASSSTTSTSPVLGAIERRTTETSCSARPASQGTRRRRASSRARAVPRPR